MEKSFTIWRMLFVTACLMILFCIVGIAFNLPKVCILYSWVTWGFVNFGFLMYKEWRFYNPKSLISRRKQIKILKYTIKNYYKIKTNGLCCKLFYGSLKHNVKIERVDLVGIYIPSFTYENCSLLAEKYGFDKPMNNTRYSYWWYLNLVNLNSIESSATRLACLNALLKELENDKSFNIKNLFNWK